MLRMKRPSPVGIVIWIGLVIAVCAYYAPNYLPLASYPVVTDVNRIQIEGSRVAPFADIVPPNYHQQITNPATVQKIIAIVNGHRMGWTQRIGEPISDSGLHPDASITLWSPKGRVMEFGIFQQEWQSDCASENYSYTKPGSAREMESFLDLLGFNGPAFYRACYSRYY
jgi:hypothetical protein